MSVGSSGPARNPVAAPRGINHPHLTRWVPEAQSALLEPWPNACYFSFSVMSIRLKSRPLKPAAIFNLVVCAFSVLMLLTLPIRSAHQYQNHFRSPEVRRTIERHTFFAHTNIGPAERISHSAVQPTLLASVEDEDAIEPAGNREFSPPILTSRLLLRPKLGSRSNSQDPLL
jgi:hypothetical protein